MSRAMLLRKTETAAPAAKATAGSTGLRIGEPDDSFEREADRVADEVMAGEAMARPQWSLSRMGIDAPLQRKCDCGGSIASGGECDECKEHGTLQRQQTQSGEQREAVPSIVHDVLRSPGRPIDSKARRIFEPRFGYDFGRIRIHTDDRAAESAKAANALAYTVGSNVVFAKGAYAPGTREGQRLLAHELAHTVQQSGFASAGLLQRATAKPKENDPTEEFDGCNQAMQNDLKAKHGPARKRVDGAIEALSKGWSKMHPADKGVFQKYFDPAGSGEIDEGFVRDVRGNYQRVRSYMSSLHFDCNPGAKTVFCGSSKGWCVDGRLMWTCFGTLYVCSNAYPSADDQFKIETIIHESTHNALLTTDREYSNSKNFKRLTPRGHGLLHVLSQIPVFGYLFRLFRSNNDTLNNPDSYSGFAGEI